MSSNNTDPGECACCEATDLQYWESEEVWTCSNCHYVVDGNENPPEPVVSGANTQRDGTVADEERPWQASVSVTDNSEANLLSALTETEEIADRLNHCAETTVRAGEIVTEAWQSNFMHGRTVDSTVAAALYLAEREVGSPRPPAIVATEAGIDKASLKNVYMDLKQVQEADVGPPSSTEYVDYISDYLDLTQECKSEAESILAEEAECIGNPVGAAAGSVYLAAQRSSHEVSLQQAATVVGMAKETIWRHADRLE